MKRQSVVLLVEDDDLVQCALKEILATEGYEVRSATDGREASQLIEGTITPDIIISDIRMPNMNGYELLGFVRSRPQLESIPFVFLSGKTATSDIRTGLALGADDYIPKPFNPEDALKSIKIRLDRSERIQAGKRQQTEYLMRYLPHELRTPLTGIMGFADIMLDQANCGQDLSRADTLEFAQNFKQCGDRLLLLTENITLWLDLNQKSTAARYPKAKFNLVDHWSDETILSAQHRANHYGRKRDLEINLEKIPLPIPENYIHRIVSQLIDNACKFSLPGTPIEVIGLVDNDSYTLTVSDMGRGMSSEQMSNIGLFRQFDRTANEQQGLGLGLAICSAFASYSNAHFSLTHNRDGSGVRATYVFSAPKNR